jgi:hypothetical protein
MSNKSSKKSLLNRVFNKSKPLATQVPLPQEKPVPRTKDQINQEYQQLCTTLGDKIVKKEGLDIEIKALFKHVESLGNELTARELLDKEADAAQKAPATPAVPDLIDTDTISPQTSGVDA